MWIGILTVGPTLLKSIRQECIGALVVGDTKSSKSYKHLFCTPGWQRSAKQCAFSYLFYLFQCGETVFPRGWAYIKGCSNLAQSKERKGNFPVLLFFPHFMTAAIRTASQLRNEIVLLSFDSCNRRNRGSFSKSSRWALIYREAAAQCLG